MKPEDFTLQPADVPQAKLLDEDPVTTKWPLPPAKPWEPKPPSVFADLMERVGL